MKLKAPVKFGKGVQPACLPQLGWDIQPGTLLYATGWGETRGTKHLKLHFYPRLFSNLLFSYIFLHSFDFVNALDWLIMLLFQINKDNFFFIFLIKAKMFVERHYKSNFRKWHKDNG